jgi:DNA-binding MarR family transcriptional regulator
VLVAIAVNAKTEAARTDVDAMLLGLRQEGLIAYRRDAHRGNGLVVTDAGRALAESKTPEPAPAAEVSPERVDPATQPELFTLLCDMGSVISERLAVAIETGDLHQAAHMQQLGRQVLRHVGGRE